MKTQSLHSKTHLSFDNLFHTMELGVVYHQNDGKIIAANPAAEQILGLSLDQMQGRTAYDPRWQSIHEDGSDFPGDTHPAMIALKTGKPVNNVVMGVFNFAENNYRWLLIHATPEFKDNETEPYQVFATFNDITSLKMTSRALLESNELVKKKLREIESPTGDLSALELTDLLDVETIQKLMDKFYTLTKLPMSISDMKGKVLVGVGWQHICTHFHRRNPETLKNCLESDTILAGLSKPGSSKLYRCKNNLWDISSPFIVDGQQFGFIFMGQFFFDDENIDFDFFTQQARQYGFEEAAYIEALKKVPRLSRETLNAAMMFFTEFSGILSALGLNQVRIRRTISEKDALLAQISKSEERFRLLVQNSNDMITITNTDGTARFISPAMEKLLGYEANELLGKNIFSTIHPDELQEMAGIFSKLLEKQGNTVNCEIRMQHKDGNYRIIEAFAQNFIGDNLIDGVVTNSRDITARKHAENELRKSEQHYRNFFEKDITGDYLSTPEGKLLDCNPAFAKMLGYTDKNDLAQINMENIYPTSGDRVAFLEKLISEKVLQNSPCDLIHKNGNIINCIENVIGLFDENGHLVQFQGYMIDITERKKAEKALIESEELYRKLLLTVPEVIIRTNLDGTIFYINDHRLPSIYHLPKEHFIGKNMLSFIAGKDKARAIENTVKMFEKPLGVIEYCLDFPENKEVYCEVNGDVVFDSNSQPIGMVYVLRDITNRKKAEEELKLKSQVLDQIKDHVTITDIYGNITYVNQAQSALFGLPVNEIIGKNTAIFGENAELGFTQNQIIQETLKQGDLRSEVVNYSQDGKIRFMDCRTQVIRDMDGNPIALSGIASDITERKLADIAIRESEAKLREAQAIAHIGNWSYDAITGKVFWSDELFKMTGTEPQEVNFRLFRSLVHPDDLEMFDASVIKASQGKNMNEMELRIVRPDGNIRWISDRWVSTFDADGKEIKRVGVSQDITERKHADEALRKSEAQFRSLFDNAADPVFLAETETGIIIDANKAAVRLMKMPHEKIVGLHQTQLHPAGKKEFYTNLFVQQRDNPNKIVGGFPVEGFVICSDGTEVPVEIMASTVTFKGKNCQMGTFRDITERKRNAETIRKNEERFSLMVKNSSDILVVIEASGIQRYVSPAIEKISGFTSEEMSGKNISEIIHPDDIKRVMEIWQEGIIQPEKLLSVEYRHLHKTKGWVELEAIGQSFLHKPDINAVIVSVREITERKKSELVHRIQFNIAHAVATSGNLQELFEVVKTELNHLIDTTNFFIAFYDEDKQTFKNAIWSDQKEHFNEWPSENTLSGIVINEGKSLFLTKQEAFDLAEIRGIQLIGSPAEFWMGFPLKIRNRNIGIMVIQSYDTLYTIEQYIREILIIVANQISLYIEKIKDEEKIVIAKNKAEESDRLKTAFLNNMSHEIRTPLNGIMGFTDLICEPGVTDELRQHYSSIINRNGNQLISIIDDIINIATIEAGQEVLHEDVSNVNTILDDLFNLFKEKIDLGKISFHYPAILDETQTSVVIDDTKLTQILTNLIRNAIKFTEKGAIEFGCELLNETLKFWVKDTGIGIPAEFHELIFDRFRQVNPDPEKLYGGNGLGLAISKAYIELMDGKIWVESSPGNGSCFYFTIPFKSAMSESKPKLTEDLSNSSLPSAKSGTILLAEDEWSNFILVETYLTFSNFSIIHVTNGLDAIEEFRKRPEINLVLMDLKMPKMTGFEAAKIMKAEKPELPIIAITAYAMAGDREKAIAAGCDDYIAKPVKKSHLLALIDKYLKSE